jgi:hypothetical protein
VVFHNPSRSLHRLWLNTTLGCVTYSVIYLPAARWKMSNIFSPAAGCPFGDDLQNDEVMQDPLFSFALTGDLKYLLTMNGNAGSSSTCPCPVCVRKRVNLVMTAPSLTRKRTLTEQLICRANAAG